MLATLSQTSPIVAYAGFTQLIDASDNRGDISYYNNPLATPLDGVSNPDDSKTPNNYVFWIVLAFVAYLFFTSRK